jgi:Copper amine oxidase N-terminal domain
MVLATGAAATVASVAVALSTPPTISIDGQRVASDVGPVTTASGAFLPLRAVSEAAGAEAGFDAKTGAITVRHGSDVLTMHLGSTKAIRNGHKVTLVHAPFTVRGRTMVSAATIEHTFGSTVRFDAKRDRVEVRTPGVVVAPVGDDEP